VVPIQLVVLISQFLASPDVVDFPTPPLLDATSTTLSTPAIGIFFGRPRLILALEQVCRRRNRTNEPPVRREDAKQDITGIGSGADDYR
jgi:hypothetical protein